MKKVIIAIIVTVVFVGIFAVESSAAENACEHKNITSAIMVQEADCTHVYEKQVTATCLDCGMMWMSLEKGSSYYHAETESVTEITPPTCTSCGWFRYHKECKLCGATVDGAIQPIAKICHDTDADGNTPCYRTYQVSVGANCDSYGYIDTIVWCDECNCEVSRTREVLPASEHFVSDWKSNENGELERRCITCDKTEVVDTDSLVSIIRRIITKIVDMFTLEVFA